MYCCVYDPVRNGDCSDYFIVKINNNKTIVECEGIKHGIPDTENQYHKLSKASNWGLGNEKIIEILGEEKVVKNKKLFFGNQISSFL